MISYAGVGSRNTPANIEQLMTLFSHTFRDIAYLQTGNAIGADTAFIKGNVSNHVVFIHNDVTYTNYKILHPTYNSINCIKLNNYHQAELIAQQAHPTWDKLSVKSKQLHTRNVYQILGITLNDPVEFVVCWTDDGSYNKTTKRSGGTGQAIRIANNSNIDVFNLKHKPHLYLIQMWIDQKEIT